MIDPITVATDLMLLEAKVLTARAQWLKKDYRKFIVTLAEIRVGMEELHKLVVPEATSEYFIAGEP